MEERDYKNLREKYRPFFDKMEFGVECGPGWYDIIDKLTKEVQDVIIRKGLEDFYVTQVKEKYGTLCFYLSYMTDEISEIIARAEEQSEKTCEVCGEEGKLIKHQGWYQVRCEKCLKQQNEPA